MIIHTVGHSNHPWEKFLALLAGCQITALADVRSHPQSRFRPHFNKDRLATALHAAGIEYLFLGKELGARSEDPGCYEDGKVQYRRLAQRETFKSGIERVLEAARTHRVALLCAEREPLDCHRTFLVGQALQAHGASISHILADGRIESNELSMARLVRQLRLAPASDLFMDEAAAIAAACTIREAQIAYSPQPRQKGAPTKKALRT